MAVATRWTALWVLVAASMASVARAQCPTCNQIVAGQTPGGKSYVVSTAAAGKVCGPCAGANAFGPCTTDAQCGGTVGTCQQTPWISLGSTAVPVPAGGTTRFRLKADALQCKHKACIGCGTALTPCPGTPGLPYSSCCDPATLTRPPSRRAARGSTLPAGVASRSGCRSSPGCRARWPHLRGRAHRRRRRDHRDAGSLR